VRPLPNADLAGVRSRVGSVERWGDSCTDLPPSFPTLLRYAPLISSTHRSRPRKVETRLLEHPSFSVKTLDGLQSVVLLFHPSQNVESGCEAPVLGVVQLLGEIVHLLGRVRQQLPRIVHRRTQRVALRWSMCDGACGVSVQNNRSRSVVNRGLRSAATPHPNARSAE
jgi:hypothetical protein